MDAELLFAEAALPASVRLLRLTLRPYSIGHEILLLRHRNALHCVSHDQFNHLPIAAQISAVIQAVLVCHRTWAQNQRREPNMRLWLWLIRKTDWPLAIADFRNYYAAAHDTFNAPDDKADEVCAAAGGYDPISKTGGRIFGAPHLCRLIDFMQSRYRDILPELNTVFDVPYAMANALYLTAREDEGKARVENRDELEEKLNWQKIVAEAKAQEEQADSKKVKPDA